MPANTVHKYLIYGLVDPRTGELRYVGKSSYGMSRPKMHLRPSGYMSGKTHCRRWIKSVVERGGLPEIIVIEECSDSSELNDSEIFYIAYFKSLGARLTNHTHGGDGLLGVKQTRDHIEKRIAPRRGKSVSMDARMRLSAATKGIPRPKSRLTIGIATAARRKAVVRNDGTVYPSRTAAALASGCTTSEVSGVISGKYKQAKGFIFKDAV